MSESESQAPRETAPPPRPRTERLVEAAPGVWFSVEQIVAHADKECLDCKGEGLIKVLDKETGAELGQRVCRCGVAGLIETAQREAAARLGGARIRSVEEREAEAIAKRRSRIERELEEARTALAKRQAKLDEEIAPALAELATTDPALREAEARAEAVRGELRDHEDGLRIGRSVQEQRERGWALERERFRAAETEQEAFIAELRARLHEAEKEPAAIRHARTSTDGVVANARAVFERKSKGLRADIANLERRLALLDAHARTLDSRSS